MFIGNRSAKRIAIFAHFDKQNIIDPYVIRYLKELRKYSEIVFISDGNLKECEINKIKTLCFDNICKKHGESNDFGSYKRGFMLIRDKYPEKLQEIDELLFVNDSCYLTGSLEDIFTESRKKINHDFWALTDDFSSTKEDKIYFLGSYFISFRKSILLSSSFEDFISSIKKLKNHDEIVWCYEIGLTAMLQDQGFKSYCYFSKLKIGEYIDKNRNNISKNIKKLLMNNSSMKELGINQIIQNVLNKESLNYLHSNKLYLLIENDYPLLKRRVITKDQFLQDQLLFLWKEILKNKDSDLINEILSNCKRINIKIKNKSCLSNIRKNILLLKSKITRQFKINYSHLKQKHGSIANIRVLIFRAKITNTNINKNFRISILGIRIIKYNLSA